MLVLELDGVEIDYCPLTHGIWLDAGELEELFESHEQAEAMMQAFVPDKSTREKKIRCPICKRKMEKVMVHHKVLVDRCVKGHGLWFDRGELLEILEMEGSEEESRVTGLLKDMFGHNLKK